MLRPIFDREGRFAVEPGLDTHVLNQIVAAAPPFGNTGSGLVAQVRIAITSMRDEGATPNLLVGGAADAPVLDLTTDASRYVFPVNAACAPPLWNLRVMERPHDAASWARHDVARTSVSRRNPIRRRPVQRDSSRT